MKIELLPSGSYRIRKMYKGKTYTVITSHKPTQKEATILLAEAMENVQDKGSAKTFKNCAEEYISMKENVLSPSTVTGYKKNIKQLSDKFATTNIYDIDQVMIQSEINAFALDHAPKTVRNLHGFISAVLKLFRPNLNINTTLPQKRNTETYSPTSDAVKKLLQECKGTKYEIGINLACYGLRRSEICAVDSSDLNGNKLTIRKARVQLSDNSWYTKEYGKTEESYRTLIIPEDLADRIKEQGCAYEGTPASLSDYVRYFQQKTGLKGFSLHKLRHYYATMLHDMGVPDSDIMKLGGWSSDYVMKKIYRHSVQETADKAQEKAIEHFKNLS